MNRQISVVVINDDALQSRGVFAVLRQEPDFRVLATTPNAEKALRVVHDIKPDVVLLSVGHDAEGHLTLAGAIHADVPACRVVIMGIESDHEDIAGFIRAGVSGFIINGATLDDVLRTIHSVSNGIRVLPDELTRSLFDQLKRHGVRGLSKRTLDVSLLTDRERQVAGLIVDGLSNKEIGVRLTIAFHTVKSHIHNLFSKLAVTSRLELAAFSRNGARGARAALTC